MDIECPLKTHVLDSSFPRLMMWCLEMGLFRDFQMVRGTFLRGLWGASFFLYIICIVDVIKVDFYDNQILLWSVALIQSHICDDNWSCTKTSKTISHNKPLIFQTRKEKKTPIVKGASTEGGMVFIILLLFILVWLPQFPHLCSEEATTMY
jgi:hypothetical protein